VPDAVLGPDTAAGVRPRPRSASWAPRGGILGRDVMMTASDSDACGDLRGLAPVHPDEGHRRIRPVGPPLNTRRNKKL
jgi:hypothetical protein